MDMLSNIIENDTIIHKLIDFCRRPMAREYEAAQNEERHSWA
jgi:hypothetical protein